MHARLITTSVDTFIVSLVPSNTKPTFVFWYVYYILSRTDSKVSRVKFVGLHTLDHVRPNRPPQLLFAFMWPGFAFKLLCRSKKKHGDE